MMKRATQKQHQSLVGQLKRSRLIVVSLIASIFLVSIPVSLIISPSQHNLDAQKGALQEDFNSIMIAMINQESGLRGYITTANSAFLQPFTDGRPQYLLAVQRLASQIRGSDFKETAGALALVEERANAWYSSYAEVQIHNMQSGQFATARAESTNAFGKALFDLFRGAMGHLQGAIGQDLNGIASRLTLISGIIFIGIVLLAVLAVIVLWRTLSRFLKALRGQLSVLMSTTALLGSGDLSARVQGLDYEELDGLGQTLNNMAEDLEEANRAILQQRDDLLVLNKALEEASQARNQFLSTMSHELRTPLTSIIGFSQLLLDDADAQQLSPQQHANLQRILKNGQHLLGLVSDVLDLEKIDAGRMEVAYEQVDVRELLTSVVEETQAMAIERHLVLRAEIEEGVGSLESNTIKLRQIMLNLVSNALKYTEQGEVIVSARRLDATGEEPEAVVLSVKDTGIGIPPEAQERIFEAFYQVQGGYTRKTGGTGLGLAITSRLTALLGGKIELTSAPGQGSTFTVTLPIKAIPLQEAKQIPRLHPAREILASRPSFPTGKRSPEVARPEAADGERNLVLAVDDNPDVIVLLKMALKDSPYTVVGVQDPAHVMELVQEMRPGAITLDVLMDDTNGWQILDQLKRNPATASIPVVMLTVISEPAAGYVLGADDYLVKPFNKETLLNTLQKVMASQKERSQAAQRAAYPVSTRSGS